ncbi:MAG: ABC transporter ATP-binding protein, partial [bacterium]|nr:ABC transporter ATP-binding protein [bacterium]
TEGVQQHVLKNLDLAIEAEDFTVIMGPSGAGKSTLLYALSGIDRPTLGTVTFSGTEISRLNQDRLAAFRRDHCGFVFQQINLLDSMSAMDNVMAPGLLRRRREVVATRANELFDLVEIDTSTRRKLPGQLSGGEAQRVALVRALINSPEVVFADEPTGQLNSESSSRVLDLLTEVHRGGQSVVMVTHDVRTAVRGSRILYLRDGTIQGELALGPFIPDDDARTSRLLAFLAEMGW